ncbi:MAG: hypothetical protein HUJ73_06780 [Eubacterium sp.]|nr:hypothetical protein [Eubacterium sp.]
MNNQKNGSQNRRPEKKKSIFRQEMERDWATFRSLSFKNKLIFIFDYYKLPIFFGVSIVVFIIIFAGLLIDGQKACRLRVCAVLNNGYSISSWFREVTNEMKKDGKKGAFDLNQDQPFDYENSYYYMHEIEVYSTIASQRMDVAICNPDMFEYLCIIDACMPLEEAFTPEEMEELIDSGKAYLSKQGMTIRDDGTVDESTAVDGYYGLDLDYTLFGEMYNTDGNDEGKPLYAAIIKNSKNPEDAATFMHYLAE